MAEKWRFFCVPAVGKDNTGAGTDSVGSTYEIPALPLALIHGVVLILIEYNNIYIIFELWMYTLACVM